MRLKTLGISTAAFVAAGAFGLATGTHVALAANNCGSAPVGAAVSVAGAVVANPTGQGVTAPATGVALCADPAVAGFEGGYLEVGGGGGPLGPGSGSTTYLTPGVPVGVYAIVDGADNNNDPVAAATGGGDRGYVGLSNYENGTYGPGPGDAPCGAPSGSGTNSGGSVGLDAFCTPGVPAPISSQGLPVPFVVCGHVSGDNWQASGRDGCWEP